MKKVENVVCPFCGCLCDDLVVYVEDNRIAKVERGCEISRTKFLTINEERIAKPYIVINGEKKEVSLEEAVEKAADILANARRPVLYGWSSTSNEAIRRGIELAELVGGVIDNTSSVCHGPTILAEQLQGIPTCTLGEVKNRADLVIFWGCNPLEAHPRHMARYSAFVKGFFTPEGRKGRKIVVVDVRKTATAKVADYFVQVKPGMDYELICAIRMAVMDKEIEVDEKFAYVFGLWTADKCSTAKGIVGIRSKNRELLEFAANFFKSLGLEPKWRTITTGYSVTQEVYVCSMPFRKDF